MITICQFPHFSASLLGCLSTHTFALLLPCVDSPLQYLILLMKFAVVITVITLMYASEVILSPLWNCGILRCIILSQALVIPLAVISLGLFRVYYPTVPEPFFSSCWLPVADPQLLRYLVYMYHHTRMQTINSCVIV